MARKRTPQLLTLQDFERAASRRLSKPAYDYFRGGADGGATLEANLRAFSRRAFLPRVLVDVSRRDMRVTIAGREHTMPVIVAPMAAQRLAHPQGELALARAAAGFGTVYTASTLSTFTLEEIANASKGPKWFQVYVHSDRAVTQALVQRAERAGFEALVLTVDVPVLGRRLMDIRNRFALPRGLRFANLEPFAARGQGSQLAAFFAARHDASLNWRDLAWLRGLTKLPLWLKGILRADDARRALDAGAAGIVVSNHGGRQLDGALAALDALPEVAAAVAGRVPVLVDGGVRWGADVLKALCLGASAVMVGRPLLWGLAVDGEKGARAVLEILREELDRAMALCGCTRFAEATPDLLKTIEANAQSARSAT